MQSWIGVQLHSKDYLIFISRHTRGKDHGHCNAGRRSKDCCQIWSTPGTWRRRWCILLSVLMQWDTPAKTLTLYHPRCSGRIPSWISIEDHQRRVCKLARYHWCWSAHPFQMCRVHVNSSSRSRCYINLDNQWPLYFAQAARTENISD